VLTCSFYLPTKEQIGEFLNMEPRSVYAHLQNLYKHYGVTTRVALLLHPEVIPDLVFDQSIVPALLDLRAQIYRLPEATVEDIV
jgi:hypothetical protein